MENVHRLTAKSLPFSHPEAFSCGSGLPGKSGLDMNWRNSGTGKMLQVVQLEEPLSARGTFRTSLLLQGEQLSFGGAQHPKGGAF